MHLQVRGIHMAFANLHEHNFMVPYGKEQYISIYNYFYTDKSIANECILHFINQDMPVFTLKYYLLHFLQCS